jgi:hypothetical protein
MLDFTFARMNPILMRRTAEARCNWTLKPFDINNISWNYGVPATCGAGFEFQAISGCYDDIAELRGEIGSRSPKFAAIDSGENWMK